MSEFSCLHFLLDFGRIGCGLQVSHPAHSQGKVNPFPQGCQELLTACLCIKTVSADPQQLPGDHLMIAEPTEPDPLQTPPFFCHSVVTNLQSAGKIRIGPENEKDEADLTEHKAISIGVLLETPNKMRICREG